MTNNAFIHLLIAFNHVTLERLLLPFSLSFFFIRRKRKLCQNRIFPISYLFLFCCQNFLLPPQFVKIMYGFPYRLLIYVCSNEFNACVGTIFWNNKRTPSRTEKKTGYLTRACSLLVRRSVCSLYGNGCSTRSTHYHINHVVNFT